MPKFPKCSYCGKAIVDKSEMVQMQDVEYEGYSVIQYRGKVFGVSNQQYCGVACMLADILHTLYSQRIYIKKDA